jgi:hypothetical protein
MNYLALLFIGAYVALFVSLALAARAVRRHF